MPGIGSVRVLIAVFVLTALCACSQPTGVASVGGPPDAAAGGSTSATPAPPTSLARAGRTGPTQHERYAPTRIVLPGGASAPIEPASTVDGVLAVPERVAKVGWWDGGAEIGDPFGSVVIAGHIDSANQGLGFFARLPALRVGETVQTRGPAGQKAAFRVYRIEVVGKAALATTGAAFDQQGDARLVLITCAGHFDRAHGGYDSNLVVLAQPVAD
jgi:hypothetical protein